MVANPPITVAGDIQEVTPNGLSPVTAETHISMHNAGNDSVIVDGDFTSTFSLVGPTDSNPQALKLWACQSVR